MLPDVKRYGEILAELGGRTSLVAVSKTEPVEEIQKLYELGQRDFGENYVQELLEKKGVLPPDIRWHFIGHLQSNKVKYIVPFISLVQSVDSFKLLLEINKQSHKYNRVTDCLFQVHIAQEETKFGLNEKELMEAMNHPELPRLNHIRICGLMGMASFTDDMGKVASEYGYLKSLFDSYPAFSILSMGMSTDYKIAVEKGSTMVRIGSLLFGKRQETPR
jgi:pyridoxal phosphate enzyme (YggS family)